jgi:UDP-N-acetylmuramyl pentapeptide synthase
MRRYLRSLVLHLLWKGALRQYRSDRPLVIAVGGSVGKTSTKEAIATLLESSGFRVTKTIGNMATDFGVALSLLGFHDTPVGMFGWFRAILRSWTPPKKYKEKTAHYYVLEYSSDIQGDTNFLTKRIPPAVAVLTTVVPVHMEQYGSEAAMVEETISLIDGVPAEGIVIANADDPAQEKALSTERLGGRTVVWYGLAGRTLPKKSGLWIQERELSTHGLHAAFTWVGGKGFDALTNHPKPLTIQTRVLGSYQLYPLAAAAAVGYCNRLTPSVIQKGLELYELPAGRGRLIEGRNEVTIIDDTANASPEAVKAGLSLLKPFAGKRRRVAILGTMNELGALSETAHKEVAEEATKHVNLLVVIGKYAPQMMKAAQAAGMPAGQVMRFATPEQFMGHLTQCVQRNDVVYIKASQNGMRLERVVKALMADPQQADKLLVRQGAYWQTQ